MVRDEIITRDVSEKNSEFGFFKVENRVLEEERAGSDLLYCVYSVIRYNSAVKARDPRVELEGALYHLIGRGNDSRNDKILAMNETVKRRIGVIWVPQQVYEMFGEEIEGALSDGEIIDRRKPIIDGNPHDDITELVLTHPEFEELDENDGTPFPQYASEFTHNLRDGSVVRGPMVRKET